MANLGLYHPTHNPFGCKLASDSKPWYETAVAFNSTKDCFTPSKLLGNSGAISSGQSGRPSSFPDTFYDAVYAHQIFDLRLSAHKQDVNKLRVDAMRKAVAGEMRGWGKVPFTVVTNVGNHSLYEYTNTHYSRFQFPAGKIPYTLKPYTLDGRKTSKNESIAGYIYGANTGSIFPLVEITETEFGKGYAYIPLSLGNKKDVAAIETDWWVIETDMKPVNFYEQSNFPHTRSPNDTLAWTDLIGSPSAISATFPNGVQGMWIPDLPEVGAKPFYGNRKVVGQGKVFATLDDGATWITGIFNESAKNIITSTYTTYEVRLCQYTTPSNFTQPANNSKVVGEVGDVIITTRHEINQGNRLHESLLGNIGKDITDPLTIVSKTKQTATSMSHQPHDLTIPANNSTGCKVATSIIEKDGLLYSQYQSQEIQFNKPARDWGDNLAIPVVNGDNVVTDDNGTTVKVVNHIGMMPLGIASYSDSSQSTDD